MESVEQQSLSLLFGMEVSLLNMTPFCKRQDCRVESGAGRMTDAYYPPVYDKAGVNQNPDRNVITTSYRCQTCGKSWTTKTINGESTIHDLKG